VNDRGPFVGNRIIDLSYAAAKRLDMVNAGTAHVEVRSIDPRDHGKDAKELLRLASADVGRQQRVTSSPALTRDGGPVFLQVGAFGSRGNAEQLQSRLARRVEEPVLVRAAAVRGASTPLYKVQVGPIRSRTDADALGRRLAALGIDKPVLVVR
jgi:rare lipoprotein A